MPVIIDCQSCGRKLRVTDDLLGQKVKCPTCGSTFLAVNGTPPEAPPGLELPPPEPAPAEPTAPPAYEEILPRPDVGDDFRDCPGCGRKVRREAQLCPNCGQDLVDPSKGQREWDRPGDVRRDCEPERGGLILTLGILSIVIPFLGPILGICAWVMGIRDMNKMRSGQMDPRGLGTTQAGLICGIVGTILEGLFSLCCVGYMAFVFMMILSVGSARPMPPRPTPVPVSRRAVSLLVVPADEMKSPKAFPV